VVAASVVRIANPSCQQLLGTAQTIFLALAALFSGVISVFSKLSTFISISRLLPFLGSFANPVFRSDKSSLTNSPVLHYLFLFSIYAIISIFLIKDFDRVATR
jgi:hypothetical protein